MNQDMVLWMAKRTLVLDYKYLIRKTGDVFSEKLEFIWKKYLTLFGHAFTKFRLGESRIKIGGRVIYYNSPSGVAGLQAVYSEHIFWLSQLDDISNKPVVVDIGANVGYFALGIKRILSNAQIYCFEPSMTTFNCLRHNLLGMKGIRLIQTAIGDKNGLARLKSDSDQPSLAAIQSGSIGESVKMMKLDTYFEKLNLKHKIDILKIDVEGYELEVIRGALKTIKRTKYIHMEFNTNAYSLSELMIELHKSQSNFQLLFIRNFSNDTDSKFEAGDLLLKVLPKRKLALNNNRH